MPHLVPPLIQWRHVLERKAATRRGELTPPEARTARGEKVLSKEAMAFWVKSTLLILWSKD